MSGREASLDIADKFGDPIFNPARPYDEEVETTEFIVQAANAIFAKWVMRIFLCQKNGFVFIYPFLPIHLDGSPLANTCLHISAEAPYSILYRMICP